MAKFILDELVQGAVQNSRQKGKNIQGGAAYIRTPNNPKKTRTQVLMPTYTCERQHANPCLTPFRRNKAPLPQKPNMNRIARHHRQGKTENFVDQNTLPDITEQLKQAQGTN